MQKGEYQKHYKKYVAVFSFIFLERKIKMFGYGNQQYNLERINNQIQELERIKASYQQPQQQPINIYNNTNGTQNDFEARFLKKDEKPEEILVQKKTAFISLENKELSIKELNGDIVKYEIILPKDEKDLKIEELERKLKKYESKYEYATTNNKKQEPTTTINEPNESTTKTNG